MFICMETSSAYYLALSPAHSTYKTGTQVFQLPPERIWVSVYEKDDEAYALWRDEVKVPESRIVRMGATDNFWAAGTTGVCATSAPILVLMQSPATVRCQVVGERHDTL